MSEKLNQLPTDDLFLLDRFINGNDDAFTIIYNRYVNQLMAYGTGWGFDKETLKDAIQDVFYKLYFNIAVRLNSTTIKIVCSTADFPRSSIFFSFPSPP